MDWHLDKGEILKTPKNEFDRLKMIFFMKEGPRDHFCKVSSDFKSFWQVTIFHTKTYTKLTLFMLDSSISSKLFFLEVQ